MSKQPLLKKKVLSLVKKKLLVFFAKKVQRLPGLREEELEMGYEIGQPITL
jgi:hypothetical protein